MNNISLAVINYRIRCKQKLMAYKGGKCSLCGYHKSVPGAYHFHHRKAETKSFDINGSTLGFQRLKQEADKCDMLCANCHAEVHDVAWATRRRQAMVLKRSKLVKDIVCKICQSVFTQKRKEQVYCSKNCQHKSMKNSPVIQLVG